MGFDGLIPGLGVLSEIPVEEVNLVEHLKGIGTELGVREPHPSHQFGQGGRARWWQGWPQPLCSLDHQLELKTDGRPVVSKGVDIHATDGPREELPEDDGHGVDVALGGVLVAVVDLGGCIGIGPPQLAQRVLVGCRRRARETEVTHFDLPILRHQQVL